MGGSGIHGIANSELKFLCLGKSKVEIVEGAHRAKEEIFAV
jgi:hypothetical protein